MTVTSGPSVAHQGSKHSEGFVRLVEQVRPHIKEISVDDWLANPNQAWLVDVREDKEWDFSHLPNALHIGKGVIERDIEQRVPNKNQPLVLYCGGGFRSALAAHTLQQMGYTQVSSLQGGIKAWRDKKLPEERTPNPGELVFDHVAIQAQSTDECLAFFKELVPHAKVVYHDPTWAFIDVNGSRVAIVTNEQHPGHLAWRVSEPHLEELAKRFNKTARAHRDRTRSFYLPGPDGLFVELISYPTEPLAEAK